MAFFDVNVFSPFAKSHVKTNLDTFKRQEEKEKKKDKYNDRVIKIEHDSFHTSCYVSFWRFRSGKQLLRVEAGREDSREAGDRT